MLMLLGISKCRCALLAARLDASLCVAADDHRHQSKSCCISPLMSAAASAVTSSLLLAASNEADSMRLCCHFCACLLQRCSGGRHLSSYQALTVSLRHKLVQVG